MKKRSKATQTLRAGCADPQTNTQTEAITIRCAAVSLAHSAMKASPIKEGIRLSRISSSSFLVVVEKVEIFGMRDISRHDRQQKERNPKMEERWDADPLR